MSDLQEAADQINASEGGEVLDTPAVSESLTVEQAAEVILDRISEPEAVEPETPETVEAAEPAPTHAELTQAQTVLAQQHNQLLTVAQNIQEAERALNDQNLDAAELSARRTEIYEAKQNLAQAANQFEANKNSVSTASMREETKALEEAIPEWKDPETAQRGKEELSDYLRAQGYTLDQISGVTDHRVFVMAYRAMQGEAQKSKRRPIPKMPRKVKKQPPTIEQVARKRNIREGSLEYAAECISRLK